ncbi:MAG: hypothetical protein J7J57_05860 [Caldisericaceae bacterium]|nr:hypothetical protein [Caldisericaceae bacterium]
MPQSELSIYLAILTKSTLPHYGNTVFTATIMGVVFFEIVGAPLLKNILTRKTSKSIKYHLALYNSLYKIHLVVL